MKQSQTSRILSITTNSLVIIPKKYCIGKYSYMTGPETPYQIKNGIAEFITAHEVLNVPVNELTLATLPYYNYHKDMKNWKVIIVDSRLKNNKSLYTQARLMLIKDTGKYVDGGEISCYFNNDLTKVRIKSPNCQRTFSLEDIENFVK